MLRRRFPQVSEIWLYWYNYFSDSRLVVVFVRLACTRSFVQILFYSTKKKERKKRLNPYMKRITTRSFRMYQFFYEDHNVISCLTLSIFCQWSPPSCSFITVILTSTSLISRIFEALISPIDVLWLIACERILNA